MRFEIVIFILAILIIGNIYTDGLVLKKVYSWKKYYQMIGIAVAAYAICVLMRRNPGDARKLFQTTHEYMKYMPVDSETSRFVSPILDFTSKQSFFNGGQNHPVVNMTAAEQRVANSGKQTVAGKSTKRSVSETKKKFVAARQGWRCGHCKEQLPAWFEVDHTIRLQHGGSNHIDNLVALCRNCHAYKTTVENL
jgi:hypothetical protein